MKLIKLFNQFEDDAGELGTKAIGFSILRSSLNVLREVVEEIEDETVTEAFKQLSELCRIRHEFILNTDLKRS